MGEHRRTIEHERLEQDANRQAQWKRWGPYLSERQWGTVREDYSAHGDCWSYFPHDQARSRAYRWGEDGLLGICDRKARLCFALALWNGRDPILKERLFGLTGPEGNHGEDVKECYFYVDSTPTHSYLKGLYKYPQAEFPYRWLVEENRRRGRKQPEFELADTGVFDEDRYFDVQVEYAKASPDDLLIRVTIHNRSSEPASIDVLPTLWFRNTWSWNRTGEGYSGRRPELWQAAAGVVCAEHEALGRMRLHAEGEPELLFTDNETNAERLFGAASRSPYRKDAFHEHIIRGAQGAVNPAKRGTKAAAHYRLSVPARGHVVLRLRLVAEGEAPEAPFGAGFDAIFDARIAEADDFHDSIAPAGLPPEERAVVRQAYAGLLWSKQFYHYVVGEWLEGDPPILPPESRKHGRNADWKHVYNRDVISMPDKWEYPWYAAWDLAFHMIPFARLDPTFAKEQLLLFLREWTMHPNGQLPAYEFALGDVNPPVHAWAAWRVYKIAARRGERDRAFLQRVFQKLLLNFTWWVNRKDEEGNNLFSGGFLGLDNIGVFDRSRALPTGGTLEQADGTAWMAFFCGTMLSMALELAHEDPVYEDMATTFFGRFIAIVDAMNSFGGSGLWDEHDGFYYDQLHVDGRVVPLRTRSMVGVIPLFAVEVLEDETINRLPGFRKRMSWFLENRRDLARHIAYLEGHHGRRLLAVPSRERLQRALRYVLDESELLSPYGVRSLSRHHLHHPYSLQVNGEVYTVAYTPGDSDTGLFGGNSNWRGPVWFPLNFLLVEALERYHHFYGDTLRVECPTGSGRFMTLDEVAGELSRRLASLFLPRQDGSRPCHGADPRFASDPHWKDLVLFSEYFNGDDGRGVGASHQTGWTALAARFIEGCANRRPA
ncbi:glucosidase [Sorangium sp. So ce1036]|uniref:MGH1-like glycoside hydrolase domain-containing protein n=1 Tax=Sorangium sp. So ce1036 TaxID=3133328 RepID=UPI003F018C41